MWVKGLVVILAIAGLFLASISCSKADVATPTEGITALAPTPPAPTSQIADGSTWILQTLGGDPVLGGTSVWLRSGGDTYNGFDGCNTFGGRFEDGKPVASGDGEVAAPPTFRTLIGCLRGIEGQADSDIELLRQGKRFRVVDDRLEILDSKGELRLAFVRQTPLAGRPVELAGSEWQLVLEGNSYEDVKAATLAFLDDRHAVGITACRGYVASYEASDERLNFRSTAMTEYGAASCAEESRIQEGQFTDDLSQAIEYSVSEEEWTSRLRIRTSRGRTVAFEPLASEVESVVDVEWHLKAFVPVGKRKAPDMALLRVDRLIPGTRVTVRFHEKGASGFGGCNFYDAKLEPEESIAREDGSFAMGTMGIESNLMDCAEPPGVTEQEKHFMELIPKLESYQIFGQLLVVHTKDDVVLIFQVE